MRREHGLLVVLHSSDLLFLSLLSGHLFLSRGGNYAKVTGDGNKPLTAGDGILFENFVQLLGSFVCIVKFGKFCDFCNFTSNFLGTFW